MEEPKPCDDKMAFDTEAQADAAAVVAYHQRSIKLSVYQCHECGLWHLSSGGI
jgi:hypothetical protein